ncbi:hypothetical protein Phum_PHUM521410 [Pediculus humanus corporis]|uniref:C2H2-type domain-containing protein n=1 Tax=Pediculus humanus subsp. corporis TaxID=121224 RepID=E0VYX9_PEDHC|nr:uncharacterized protein Phum_PHUM521410 [Pediculus humanus corporis]EEB18585.1 hypothetical protein Phum_PHUM521410 [Pediculus humanus corporis]
MNSDNILEVFPTAEELSLVRTKIKCPQTGCESVFLSTSNLNMHLIKRHKIANNGLTKKSEMQFFCPVESCSYFKKSKKHFTKLKYLKQHFLKVHASKDLSCNKCEKKFSTEAFKSSHMKHCGKLFTCTCGLNYTSSEAILTHCKRKGKGHIFLEEKNKNVSDNNNYDVNFTTETKTMGKKPERLIYPKLSNEMSFPIHYIAAVALSELSLPCNLSKVVDKGIQTDLSDLASVKNHKNNTILFKTEKKRKNSQHTQTISKLKKLKISTQTQTSIDYLKPKNKNNVKTIIRKKKKSMETQTKDYLKSPEKFTTKLQYSLESSCDQWTNTIPMDSSVKNEILLESNNKSDILEEIKEVNESAILVKNNEKKWIWDNHFFVHQDKVLSSEESKGEDPKSELLNIATELNNLYNKEMNLAEFTPLSEKNKNQCLSEQGSDSQMFDLNKLCNIETQTEIDTFLMECGGDEAFTLCSTTETQTTDDFDSLLYSNMCTQTCEEVDLLFNFNFVNNQTQTSWPELNDCSEIN